MPITVLNRTHAKLDRTRLRRVAAAAMQAEGCLRRGELNIVIGDDAWIQELNETYKGVRRPTDVLAFPQDAFPKAEDPILGDVAISLETAARQAATLGHPAAQELEILLVHGILHLTGWRDDTPPRRRRMMARTQEILAQTPGATRP